MPEDYHGFDRSLCIASVGVHDLELYNAVKSVCKSDDDRTSCCIGIRKQSTVHRFIRNSQELICWFTALSTHPLIVPPRTFSLVRHLKEMGPSTGVSLAPPRRRRERTSSTRFRVATSMTWKFIVATRTCSICTLLRFDGKKWCFSRLSDSSSALPFPDRKVLTTGSNAPRPYKWLGRRMQRATIGVIYTSGEIAIATQPAMPSWRRRLIPRKSNRLCLACECLSQFFWPEVACSTAVKFLYSTVATAQLAVHTETESRVQRAATFSLPSFCLYTCSCLETIEPSRGECKALRARPGVSEVCTPQNQCYSPALTFLTVGSKKHRRRQR